VDQRMRYPNAAVRPRESCAGARRRRFTILRMMAMVGCLAIGSYFLRLFIDFSFGRTLYSVRYSESGFQSLRVGMTGEEVEAIMGPPRRKVPWSGYAYPVVGGDENWWYSEPDSDGDYWRKWVVFRSGKILTILNQWYID
jgi:hypothetical protein